MPYHLSKGAGAKPWKIVKTATGEVVGSSTSRTKAIASISARMGHETRKVNSLKKPTKY